MNQWQMDYRFSISRKKKRRANQLSSFFADFATCIMRVNNSIRLRIAILVDEFVEIRTDLDIHEEMNIQILSFFSQNLQGV